ncbi:zinc knuckle (CCHC-type) family protein [Thalictrum thalictroides]|uniref:Zinc knuckle (CCHC-type) family protein n=1 Tax=Thalictrum thalictroides TaxID=46969 RepID=A0A7J6X2K0_THATH|nr:zinc knuckle (CCHC-type) family protein [Thalictrum thalictroides]
MSSKVPPGNFVAMSPSDRLRWRKEGRLVECYSPKKDTNMEDATIEKDNVINEMDNKEDNMELEKLEEAFNKRWNLEKMDKEIDLRNIEEVDEERWSRTLIGKLQTKKWFGEKEIRKELVRNWNTTGKFDFSMVAEGICTVVFNKEADYTFVLENGPWDIHGFVMSFKEWSRDIILSDFEFPFFPMWIQIFGLPLERHSAKNVNMIGTLFGQVLKVDSVGSAEGRTPYARVQVKFNIHNPIKKEANVRLSEGKTIIVAFKYERLPLYCFYCGLIGHDHGVCKEMKEGLRKLNRELSKEELKQVLNFSFHQKAKSFKFGAGIQKRHVTEVDPVVENELDDQKFRQWRDGRWKEDDRKRRELTQASPKKVLTIRGSLGKKEEMYPDSKEEKEGCQVMEVEVGMSKDRANQSADKESSEVTNQKGVGELVQSGEVWNKEQSEVKSMDISPMPYEKGVEGKAESVNMMDINDGKANKVAVQEVGEPDHMGITCRKKLFTGEPNLVSQAIVMGNLDHSNLVVGGSGSILFQAQPTLLSKPSMDKSINYQPTKIHIHKKPYSLSTDSQNLSSSSSKRKCVALETRADVITHIPPCPKTQPLLQTNQVNQIAHKVRPKDHGQPKLSINSQTCPTKPVKIPYSPKKLVPLNPKVKCLQEPIISEVSINKKRRIEKSSSNLQSVNNLLFSGNFRRIWNLFLSDLNMKKMEGEASREEKGKRRYTANLVTGTINMGEEEKAKVTNEWFQGLLDRLRAVRGKSIFDPESVKVGTEVSDLQNKGFSFAKALMINGVGFSEEKEFEEDYAMFLLAYAEDVEEEACGCSRRKDHDGKKDDNQPNGSSAVAGHNQPPLI